jgi:hypothetical protein
MRHREEKEEYLFSVIEKIDIARLDTVLTAHRKIKKKVEQRLKLGLNFEAEFES